MVLNSSVPTGRITVSPHCIFHTMYCIFIDQPPSMVSIYSTAGSSSMVESPSLFQKSVNFGGTGQISQIQPMFLDLPTSSPIQNETQV